MTTHYKHTVVEPDQLLYNLRNLSTRQHEHLRRVLERIAGSYSDDQGTAGLFNDQPVSVKLELGDVRLVRQLLR